MILDVINYLISSRFLPVWIPYVQRFQNTSPKSCIMAQSTDKHQQLVNCSYALRWKSQKAKFETHSCDSNFKSYILNGIRGLNRITNSSFDLETQRKPTYFIDSCIRSNGWLPEFTKTAFRDCVVTIAGSPIKPHKETNVIILRN